MKKILTPLFFIYLAGNLFAQNAYIKGKVADSKTKETFVGANVVIDDTTGTATDIDGNYFIKTNAGKHKIEYRMVGFKSLPTTVELKENDTLVKDVVLENNSKQLDVVVVSAGRFEQKLGDVTVSMEVLKPSLIESKSIQTIEKAVDQVPGVNVIDGQANIRGGSGFSYGAGSRVLLLVDEMPMLTADAGDVKWTALPIENCEQIEVIKGASSALFGSSALNGVINFRTAYAKEDPETKINMYGGVYAKPKRKELAWWQDGNPTYSGINFYHAQKIKQLDVVIGANLYSDEGYRKLETEQRYRANVNLRYRFKKIKGLSVGVNANTIRTKGGLFLIWVNPDSALYPTGGDLSHYTTYRTNIDPYLIYNTKNDGKHTLRARVFRTTNLNNTNQESTADVYYSEYQFQKRFKNTLVWTTGIVYNYNEVHSDAMYGNHFSNNVSAYVQLDKKFFKKLNVSLGLRGEYFKTDTLETREDVYLLLDASKPIAKQSKVKPITRVGLNYHLFEATFLRASFGQGFRFPTVAERFIRTSASGLEIYPNRKLSPESGWSAEFGIKQGVRLGEWKGFVDVAAFWTEYRNMMEFTFGQYAPPKPPYATIADLGIGFQSQNIGNTRIRGVDFSLMGQGKMGPVSMAVLAGYTYIDPRQTDFDPKVDTAKNTSKTDILKYRFQHTGKADVEFGYKKISLGFSMRANSFMENMDAFFEDKVFFPGMKKYRAEHNKGDAVFDARFGFQMHKIAKLSIIVNNVFNREYMSRPACMQPPRTFAMQLSLKF
jgi:iron complex outermembrane receptor protein